MGNKPKAGEQIIVMGEVIKKSDMPEIYRLARANKAELEKTVKAIMKTDGTTNAGGVMAILESDLG